MRAFLFCLFVLLMPLFVHADTPHKTICLNMIVKNESAVITRCLQSLLPMIDYWVIVDTGSTDNTREIITDFMKIKGVPGELHNRPWVDFGHNRNEALQLARGKGDYVFFIDADEFLMYASDFTKIQLDKDYYYVTTKGAGVSYMRLLCINNHLEWKWEGVLHEVISPPPTRVGAIFPKVMNITTCEGVRSKDPAKIEKDVAILEKAVKDEPTSSRYEFYLAQTYFEIQKYELALQHYEKRIQMGGWDEEVFWSLLRIAQAQELLSIPQETVIASYKKAYLHRSSRAEPLYYLAHYLRSQGEYAMGYDAAKLGLTLPFPKDILFIDQWVYDYGLSLELSICAFWVNRYVECQATCLNLMSKPDLPAPIRADVEKNLGFANAKLLESLGTKTITMNQKGL